MLPAGGPTYNTEGMLSNNILTGIVATSISILILLVIIIIMVLLVHRQTTSQLLKESLYKNKLHEAAMASLRAQMNPHFIFNCLNSIRLYTEQNNPAAASAYLNKSATLIRRMLDNARAGHSSLASELDTLGIYLELEQMRFKDRLQYEITVDDGIDADFTEIPPLLIQPYVENAIWHGIMHKNGGGKVTIKVGRTDKGNLRITIADDGVGRSAAGKLQRTDSRPSHGMQIAAERIALINENHSPAASISVTDRYDDRGTAAGTLVTIELPLS